MCAERSVKFLHYLLLQKFKTDQASNSIILQEIQET